MQAPGGGGQQLTHGGGSFAIYSVKWSGDGREIIAGTNDERVGVECGRARGCGVLIQ